MVHVNGGLNKLSYRADKDQVILNTECAVAATVYYA